MADLTPRLRRRQALRRPALGLPALGLVAAVALLAAGCGSGTPSGTGTSSTAPPATASPQAGAPATVSWSTNSKFGKILVDSRGFTLYTYKLDTSGKSNCSGTCASTWPPLVLSSGTATPVGGAGVSGLGVIMRADGSHQVTYDGAPLYTYSGDSAAGQANGQGVENTWYVVKSGATTSGGATTTTVPPTSSSSAGGYGY